MSCVADWECEAYRMNLSRTVSSHRVSRVPGGDFICDLMRDSRRCNSAFDEPWKLKRHKEGVH